MAWADAVSALNTATVDYFGEAFTYLSLDGLTTADIISTMTRGTADGDAVLNLEVSNVAAPGFGDKVTGADAVEWRISEVLQPFSGRTPCNMKRGDFWKLMNLEEYSTSTDKWITNTTNILAMITTESSSEVVSADDGHSVDTFQVRTQYLTTPTRKMRFKWGSRYLYITGIRPDASYAKFTNFDCVEDEA